MNIHSYDVLMIALVMVGFLAMQLSRREVPLSWIGRAAVIAAGVLPAALWFVHVLQADPVFQSRAATPTYSANFRQVFFGYVLMMLLAFTGLWMRARDLRARLGIGLLALLIIGLYAASGSSYTGFFLSGPVWAAVAAVGVVSLILLAGEDSALNLILAWAVMGLIALYFPALFQRKLAMGLSVPWAILATLGFQEMVRSRDRSARNLATVLAILVLGATSILWLVVRDRYLISHDVSVTTVHPVFLNNDERSIVAAIDKDPRLRKVILAMPGVPSSAVDENGQPIPDSFLTPAIPDLNPIVSGLAGAYSYSGHWSETPDYAKRRSEVSKVFLASTPEAERAALLEKIGPDYVIEPASETYGGQIAELSGLGQVVYAGGQFKLIKLTR